MSISMMKRRRLNFYIKKNSSIALVSFTREKIFPDMFRGADYFNTL